MGYTLRDRPVHSDDGKTLLIQPKDVTDRGFLKMETPCRFDFAGSGVLNKGDVLLLARGRFTACLFEDDQGGPCVATSAFIILTLSEGVRQILPQYLTLFLNSARGQNLLNRRAEETTVPCIGCEKLGSVKIPVPPIQEQQEVVDFWLATRDYVRLVDRRIELLNNLVNSQLTSIE